MARDYDRRRPAKQKNSAPKQLLWVVASFLCGYLTATVFDFTSLSSWVSQHILEEQNEGQPQTQVTTKPKELPKPKLEFYTLLAKDRHVATSPSPQANVQARPTSPSQSAPAPLVTATPSIQSQPILQPKPGPAPIAEAKVQPSQVNQKETYLVQIASFKNKQDAERMKAMLILKGFDVKVSMTIQQQVNWFRVIVGPFSSRGDAEKARVTLARTERISGMVRRMDA